MRTGTKRKIVARLIHFFNPNYFKNRSYRVLRNWRIEDVVDGKLIFKA